MTMLTNEFEADRGRRGGNRPLARSTKSDSYLVEPLPDYT